MSNDPYAKRPVPGYLMSFGDMMTLILTFFILLVSMASEQKAGFVAAGTGSFVRAINACGLPGLLPSGRKPITLGDRQTYYRPSETTLDPLTMQAALDTERILRPVESKLREDLVERLRRGREVAMPTGIAFVQDTLTLTRKSQELLNEFIGIAQSSPCHIKIQAHLDPKTHSSDQRRSFVLSAQRAHAVARYLHQRGGVPWPRMTPVGYGSFRPLVGKSARDDNERISILFCKPPKIKTPGDA